VRRIAVIPCLAAAVLSARGCTTVAEWNARVDGIAYYVEYLVRGDMESALRTAQGEKNKRFLKIYRLFLPRRRSLDDEKYYYPVFVENRRKRFPRVREFKRAGLVGEGLDGMLKIVDSNPVAGRKPFNALLKELVLRENFDRKRIIGYILQNTKVVSEEELTAAFARVRRSLALHGDLVECTGPKGERVWRPVSRE